MRSSRLKKREGEGEMGRGGEKKNNKDDPDEIATSSNQKTVSLLAMTDLVDENLTPSKSEGSG